MRRVNLLAGLLLVLMVGSVAMGSYPTVSWNVTQKKLTITMPTNPTSVSIGYGPGSTGSDYYVAINGAQNGYYWGQNNGVETDDIEAIEVIGGPASDVIDLSDIYDDSPGNGLDEYWLDDLEHNIIIRGNGGDDTITGSDRNDEIEGGAGNDTLDGADGSDEIQGGADDDTIEGGSGDDTVNGNGGDDLLLDQDSGDAVSNAVGIKWTSGTSKLEVTINGDESEAVFGHNGVVTSPVGFEVTLNGTRLIDSSGNAISTWGLGEIVVNGSSNADTIDLSAIVSPAWLSISSLTVHGNAGNDTIDGSQFGDVIYGGTGTNTIDGHNGDDRIGGTDFYVDNVSGSDSNAGTSSTAPFATIQKAVDTLLGGTTVWINTTTSPYKEHVVMTDRHGTASKRIVIKGDNGMPEINGYTQSTWPHWQNLPNGSNSNDNQTTLKGLVQVVDCTYVTLDNLKVMESNQSGISVTATSSSGTTPSAHIIIKDCEVRESRSYGIIVAGRPIVLAGGITSTHNPVDDVTIHDNKLVQNMHSRCLRNQSASQQWAVSR